MATNDKPILEDLPQTRITVCVLIAATTVFAVAVGLGWVVIR